MREIPAIETLCQVVEMVYSDGYSLVNACQEYGIEIVVPMRAEHSWQQRAGQGYDLYHFQEDGEMMEKIAGPIKID